MDWELLHAPPLTVGAATRPVSTIPKHQATATVRALEAAAPWQVAPSVAEGAAVQNALLEHREEPLFRFDITHRNHLDWVMTTHPDASYTVLRLEGHGCSCEPYVWVQTTVRTSQQYCPRIGGTLPWALGGESK